MQYERMTIRAKIEKWAQIEKSKCCHLIKTQKKSINLLSLNMRLLSVIRSNQPQFDCHRILILSFIDWSTYMYQLSVEINVDDTPMKWATSKHSRYKMTERVWTNVIFLWQGRSTGKEYAYAVPQRIFLSSACMRAALFLLIGLFFIIAVAYSLSQKWWKFLLIVAALMYCQECTHSSSNVFFLSSAFSHLEDQ